jgi:hypothetical protein
MNKYALLTLVSLVLSANASQLPFSENFDALTLGSVDTKNDWVSLSGTNNIQSDVIAAGSQALEIKSGMVQHYLSNTSGGTSVWVSFQARITTAPNTPPTVTNANTSVAFFVNTNLNLVVLNGTNTVELSKKMELNSWTRFDVYCDYGALTWKLNINGTNVAENLGLYSSNPQIDSLVIANESSDSAYFDELVVETTDDANSNGIPDWWEQRYFGGITNAPSGIVTNGMTCEQMYIAGLEPDVTNDALTLAQTDRKRFNWNRKTGRRYDIYWASNLTSGFTFIQTATGSEFQDTATNRIERPAGFYKIKVSR